MSKHLIIYSKKALKCVFPLKNDEFALILCNIYQATSFSQKQIFLPLNVFLYLKLFNLKNIYFSEISKDMSKAKHPSNSPFVWFSNFCEKQIVNFKIQFNPYFKVCFKSN